MNASTKQDPKATPGNTKAPANGASDGKPALSAAEQLAAASAALEQAQALVREHEATKARIEAEERARVLGERLVDVDAEMAKWADARKIADLQAMLAIVGTTRTKLIELMRELGVSTKAPGSGGSRATSTLPKSIPDMLVAVTKAGGAFKVSELRTKIHEEFGLSDGQAESGAIGAALNSMCGNGRAVDMGTSPATFTVVQPDTSVLDGVKADEPKK